MMQQSKETHSISDTRQRVTQPMRCNIADDGFGGLVVSMLASGTQDRGFEPGRNRWIFRAKISTACLLSEGK
jgi:hypothetical protein